MNDDNKQLNDAPQEDEELLHDTPANEGAVETSFSSNYEEPKNQPPKKKSGFKTRFFTGSGILLLYATVATLTVVLGWFPIFDVFAISITLVVTYELCKAVGNKFPKPMMVIVAITVVLGFVVYYLVHFLIPFPGGGISAYIAVLALMFLVAIIYNMFSKKHSMPNVLSTMFVLVYPATIGVYMLALNYLPQGNLPQGRTVSNAAILLLFLIPALADTFAYFVGSLFKGPKLAPSISPKKTISGAVGGILGGVAAGAIVLALSFISGSPIAIGRQPGGVNIAHFLVMGGVGAIFVILGDLLASYVKRQCDIKDFGKILPGHGGILDRVDGMLLCGVFLFVYFYVLNFSWAY